MSFQASNSWESPAASTFSLILNRRYTIVFSPIPRRWYIFKWFLHRLSFICGWAMLLFSNWLDIEIIFKFFISHVGILIYSFFERKSRVKVVLSNALNFLSESHHSFFFRFDSMIRWLQPIFRFESFPQALEYVVIYFFFSWKVLIEILVDFSWSRGK